MEDNGIGDCALSGDRRSLLVQLSLLRACLKQLGRGLDDTEQAGADANSPSSSAEEQSSTSESALGQSDRDAIEAFFNSDDDFTRLFNEGAGDVKRAGLLDKVSTKGPFNAPM